MPDPLTPQEVALVEDLRPLLFSRERTALGKVLALAHEAERLRAQTCETCRFAGGVNQFWAGRQCHLDQDMRNEDGDRLGDTARSVNFVPLTLNGEPFGCRGWQPTPASRADAPEET